MILDDYIARFLSRTEPLIIHLAVSGEDNRPYSIRSFGIGAVEGSGSVDTLRIYVLKTQAYKLQSYISKGSGIIACLFTDGRTNESYQCKGVFLEYGACGEEDVPHIRRHEEQGLRTYPRLYERFPLSPAVCDFVAYRIDDIFVQTPGPNAGMRYTGEGMS